MRRRSQGFTLLEVVVALAILALALMAIFDMNAGAMRMHSYTKRLTVATLLARSKMTDLEQNLYDKGFSTDDEEDSGDFSDEGWESFKWRARILAPKTDGISPEQVIGAVFGIPLGPTDPTASGGSDSSNPLSALAGLFGGGAGAGSGAPGGMPGMPDPSALAGLLGGGGAGAPGAPGGAAGGLMGMMGPLMSTQFQQMVQQITQSVREIHLTVMWKEGKNVESIDLVTDVVSLGPGSDRNGLVAGGQSLAGNGLPQGPLVDAITGAPVPNPVPAPNGSGGFINPATGNQAIPAPGGAAGAMGGMPGMPGMPGTNPVIPGGNGLPSFGNPMFNRMGGFQR